MILLKSVFAGGRVQAARARKHQDHGVPLRKVGEGAAGPAGRSSIRNLENADRMTTATGLEPAASAVTAYGSEVTV